MSWFRISFAENAFQRVLKAHGWKLDSITIDEGVAAMLEFYVQHRAQHTDLRNEDDGLLVQWSDGVVDLTRQLIRAGSPDSPIHQLSLSFAVDGDLPEAGNAWYFDPSAPIEVPPFFTGTPVSTRLRFDVL